MKNHVDHDSPQAGLWVTQSSCLYGFATLRNQRPLALNKYIYLIYTHTRPIAAPFVQICLRGLFVFIRLAAIRKHCTAHHSSCYFAAVPVCVCVQFEVHTQYQSSAVISIVEAAAARRAEPKATGMPLRCSLPYIHTHVICIIRLGVLYKTRGYDVVRLYVTHCRAYVNI